MVPRSCAVSLWVCCFCQRCRSFTHAKCAPPGRHRFLWTGSRQVRCLETSAQLTAGVGLGFLLSAPRSWAKSSLAQHATQRLSIGGVETPLSPPCPRRPDSHLPYAPASKLNDKSNSQAETPVRLRGAPEGIPPLGAARLQWPLGGPAYALPEHHGKSHVPERQRDTPATVPWSGPNVPVVCLGKRTTRNLRPCGQVVAMPLDGINWTRSLRKPVER